MKKPKIGKRETEAIAMVNWEEFFDRLCGLEGCNFREEDGSQVWTCGRDAGHPFSRTILARMGVLRADIDKCVRYFEAHGGYCDFEVVLNVMDDLVPSAE
jgi:hypothetical protein